MEKEQKYLTWLKQDKYGGRSVSSARLAEDLARLCRDEPIDYVIGWRPFLGCKIGLTERPLIPRAETEYWVGQAIAEIKKEDNQRPLKCLDIFAGSGCIGVAILAQTKQAKVVFADKSPRALKSIRKNLRLNRNKIGLRRARVLSSDIFSEVAGTFDYIFANPPYIPLGRRLPRSVADYEPTEALFGGKDGLFYLKKFLSSAPAYLTARGKIYLEFGVGQKMAIDKILKKLGFQTWVFGRDQFGRYRFAIIQNSG